MEIKSILSNIKKEEKEVFENSAFLKSFSNFLIDYFSFVVLFLILLLWQLFVIFDLSYSEQILELFVCIALVQQIREKFIKSVFFIIPIIVVIILLFALNHYKIHNTQWIIILGILIGMKVNSLIKSDKNNMK